MPAKLSEGRRRAFVHTLTAQSARLTGGAGGRIPVGLITRSEMVGRLVAPMNLTPWARILRAGDFREFHARSTAAWMHDDAGMLVQVPANVLRICRAPSGAPEHALLEPASTNQHLNSATAIASYTFTASGAGDLITANYGIGADGINTTTTRVQTGVSSRVIRFVSPNCGIDATATAYCVAVYYRGAAPPLSAGARGGATVSPVDMGAVPGRTDGLKRAYYPITSGANATAFLDFTMSANSDIEIGDIQTEKNRTDPTSQIVTVGSQVTRGGDTCFVPTSTDARAYLGELAGTAYIAGELAPFTTSQNDQLYVQRGSSNAVGPRMAFSTGSSQAIFVDTGGAGVASLSLGASPVAVPLRMVATWRYEHGYQAAQAWNNGTLTSVLRNTAKTITWVGATAPTSIGFGNAPVNGTTIRSIYIKTVGLGKRSISEDEMTNLLVNGL